MAISAAPELTPAEANVADQLTHNDGVALSLSSIWRAAGAPEGRDPATWADGVARPFLVGYERYSANLARAKQDDSGGSEGSWVMTDPEIARDDAEHGGGHWQVGDVMGPYLIAVSYATYVSADS